jgi:chromosome segregation ATPase
MTQRHGAAEVTHLRPFANLQRCVAELNRGRTESSSKENRRPSAHDERPPDRPANHGLDRFVETIESAGNMISDLQAKISAYEETIYDLKTQYEETLFNLKAQLASLSAQREAAYQQAAKAEIRIRVEVDRAELAETRARVNEERIKDLELREGATQTHLDRVNEAMSKLFSRPPAAFARAS